MASPRVVSGRKEEGCLKSTAAVATRAIELRRATTPRREALRLTSQVGAGPGWVRQYLREDRSVIKLVIGVLSEPRAVWTRAVVGELRLVIRSTAE